MNITKSVFSVQETAILLNCPTARVYKLISAGIISAYKDADSNIWHITEESIKNYQNARIALYYNK